MRGFSTLEVVIAMMVLVLALGGTAATLFGNQSLLPDTRGSAEALAHAQSIIENAKAVFRKDSRLAVSSSTSDDVYEKTLAVSDAGFFAKLLTASVRWKSGAVQRLIELPVFIADSGADTTCDADLSGDWTHPQLNGFDFASLVHDTGSLYVITDVDAYQGRLYASVNTAGANSKPTFFVFDVADSAAPVLIGSLDNAPVSAGINALAVATTSTQHYAYAANAYDANFRTCKPAAHCAQLQVIDITDPLHLKIAANYELPTSSPPYVLGNGGGGNAIGKSIFYKNGYVYLGLSKTTSGPEFHIIDVKDPLHPKWTGSYPPAGQSSGSAINAIYVRQNHAYLATPNTKELTVLDITDPANPVFIGTYDAPGGSGNGKSLDVVGDTLYLGRTVGGKELYVLDVSDPSSPSLLGEQDTGSASVAGVFVRDFLAFLAVGNQFQIWNVGNPAHTAAWAPPLLFPGGSLGTALDCEGNTLYAASVTASGAGFLSSISSL